MKLLFIFLLFVLPSLGSNSYEITLPNGLKVNAEVAEDKQKGLQGRESLCNKCGMIFIFREDGLHGFWMKDTLINLAMVWIGRDGNIVHIVENAEPCVGKDDPYTECRVFVPTYPARYVLEINPKAAAGLKPGMKLKSEPPLF